MNQFWNSHHPYALITIICWSIANVYTRLAVLYYTPEALGFLRYAIASAAVLCLLPFVKPRLRLPKSRDIKWFFAAGGTGFFLYMLFFNKGCQTVPAAAVSVIIATAPVLTALFARFIYKEKLDGIRWFAILVEFLGVAALVLMDGLVSLNPGMLWVLLAALALSLYNLLQRKLTRAYTAMETSAYSIFAGTLLLSIFLPEASGQLPAAPQEQIFYLLLLGIFSGAVAYISWAKAFSKAKKASSVSNYMFLTPFVTSLLGFVAAGERLDRATLIGGGVILLGLVLFYFGGAVRGVKT